MHSIRRAIVLGAAYGLAVTAVELWFASVQIMGMGMPPMPKPASVAAGLEVVLGCMLGLASTPVRKLAGAAAQAVAMALAWMALERYVAIDPSVVKMWLAGPAAGLVLLAAGWWIAGRYALVPWAIGVVAVVASVVVPTVSYRMHNEPTGVALARSVIRRQARPQAPDVVMVVLDTVRARSMSTYGYGRDTSPTFGALASEGALFLDATSPSTWSLPSHASLFTGWFPSAHNTHGEHRVLGLQPPTLADVLYRNGYDTLCFTANPHISDGFGLTRGFAWSDRAYLSGSGGRSFLFVYRLLDLLGVSANDKGGGDVAGHFEHWVKARGPNSKPAFAFLNFLEAHFPYHQVPPEFLAKFTRRSRSQLREFSLETFGAQFGRHLSEAEVADAVGPATDMYDAGVLYSDYLLHRVVEALRRSGRLDKTLLVVLADHGEMLGEHGNFGHGASLYQPDLHVPLLIRFPGRISPGLRIEQPVSTLGVYATVLDLAGLEAPGRVQVGSLTPALDGEIAGQPVIAERFRGDLLIGSDQDLLANRRYRVYRSGKRKLVEDADGGVFLFDLAADPEETVNLAERQPAQTRRLRDELASWVAKLGLPALDAQIDFGAGPQVDDATRQRLQALGYVN